MAKSKEKANKVVAVVDIGASAIHMAIAETGPGGRMHVLEAPAKPVAIGRDVFTVGRISRATRSEAIEVLKGFKDLMRTYQVSHARVIATSAVREAADRDMFIDWVYVRTGLDVEVIDGVEENQLIFAAVQQELGDRLGSEPKTLIMEVGGGSTELMVLQRGEIALSQPLPLGAVRMQQRREVREASPTARGRLFRREINGTIDNIRRQFDLGRVTFFVALGSDMRFAARALAGQTGGHVATVPAAAFQSFVRDVSRMTSDQVVDRFGLPFADAETLAPSLMVYSTFLEATGATELAVPDVTLRDGLLLGVADLLGGRPRSDYSRQIIASAKAIGRKYQYDEKHSLHVTKLALRLFDELSSEHTLGPRERLLLELAGILHDVGFFIGNQAHHKHSHYIVSQSDIFGLRKADKDILADVVRYHRKATPSPTHVEYMSLPRTDRVIVCKLAAILRVADALDRAHLQRVERFTVEHGRDALVVRISGVDDLSVERGGLKAKGDLFEDVFGMSVVLEEASAA